LVVVSSEENTLKVEVRNFFVPSMIPAPALPGAGTGLIGLAERVALVGGELRQGVVASDEFVIEAILPWERRAR
jgi:glucose-6-phosphate-specific signal transduction histidine kinase